MTGERQKSSRVPSFRSIYAVPIIGSIVILSGIVIAGVSHPPDSRNNYLQIALRNAVDVLARRPEAASKP